MDPVHDRGSMNPVHESGPWTRSKVGVHGPLAHVLSSAGSDRFYSLCVQFSHGCALLERGDLWDTINSALE